MRVTADTNVLVRAFVEDDERQGRAARTMLATSDMVALALPALCEFVWVLSQGYKLPRSQIGGFLRDLIGADNVVVNRPAVDAGVALLEAGGDFADGVIAYEGRWLGADCFVSFDREAVTLLESRGEPARLLR